jgi:hypothetical protein
MHARLLLICTDILSIYACMYTCYIHGIYCAKHGILEPDAYTTLTCRTSCSVRTYQVPLRHGSFGLRNHFSGVYVCVRVCVWRGYVCMLWCFCALCMLVNTRGDSLNHFSGILCVHICMYVCMLMCWLIGALIFSIIFLVCVYIYIYIYMCMYVS